MAENYITVEQLTKSYGDKPLFNNIGFGINKGQKTAKGMSHGEYTAASKGYSWKFQLINTIEDAMNVCKKKKEFIAYMESEGYKVNWTDARKTICYTAPNGMKCRDYKLHEDKFLKENKLTMKET